MGHISDVFKYRRLVNAVKEALYQRRTAYEQWWSVDSARAWAKATNKLRKARKRVRAHNLRCSLTSLRQYSVVKVWL